MITAETLWVFLLLCVIYYVGIKYINISQSWNRKLYISFSLWFGLIFLLTLWFLSDEEITQYSFQGILFSFLVPIISLFVSFIVIGLPISLLSDRIAKDPFRIIKSLLIHVSPVILLSFINWRYSEFLLLALIYWVIDELLRRTPETNKIRNMKPH